MSDGTSSPGVELELSGLHKGFGSFVAVDGVDLTVRPGEFVTLLGPSRLGQDDHAQHDRRLRRADRGHDPHRRPRRHRAAARTSATSAWCSRTTRCSRT